jgi:hypothetical protein
MEHILKTNIGNSTINNDLWTSLVLKNFGVYIFKNENTLSVSKLFSLEILCKTLKKHVSDFLKITDSLILKIYWEEFKTIRLLYKEIYFTSLNEYLAYKDNLENEIFKLLKVSEIQLDSTKNVIDNIKLYIEDNSRKTDTECKICYDNNATHLLQHKKHSCTICKECSQKILSSTCPFCKSKIEKTVKLIVH